MIRYRFNACLDW